MLFRCLLLILLAVSCSSSRQQKNRQKFENLTQISPPGSAKHTPSKVYIDSVKIITQGDKKALLISGNFANGCTKLKKADHVFRQDSLLISLEAWKPSDKICTQALVPFSFIYNQLPGKQLQNTSTLRVNNKKVKFRR